MPDYQGFNDRTLMNAITHGLQQIAASWGKA
jgi:hypothetical protein